MSKMRQEYEAFQRNISRVEKFIRAKVKHIPLAPLRQEFLIAADWLVTVAAFLHRRESFMGRIAQDVQKLRQAVAAAEADRDHFKGLYEAASASAPDSDDLAALGQVEKDFPDATPAVIAPRTDPAPAAQAATDAVGAGAQPGAQG